MLVVFQFPIADLRSLSAEVSPVSLPTPPRTLKNDGIADSLRYFGWAANRAKGADHAFKDESIFYSAHNALSFQKGLGKKVFAKAGVEVKPKVDTRRRIFIPPKRLPSVRLEIEIGVETVQRPLEFDALIKLLTTVLVLPSNVQMIKNLPADLLPSYKFDPNAIGPLALHGKALASHFALATTKWHAEDCRKANDLVRACQPVLIVQFESGEVNVSEIADNFPIFKKLGREQTGGANVWYGLISSGHRNRIPCWLIGPGRAKQPAVARSLRICLLRLHAEHRTLEEVLRWHDRAAEPKLDTEKLASYLGSTWDTVLERKNRTGLDQSALMAAISTLAAVRPEEQSIDLKNRSIEVKRSLNLKSFRGEKQVESPLNWRDWLKNVEPQPDLTVAIHNPRGSSELQWSFHSPHKIIILPEPESIDIGDEPEKFLNSLLDMAVSKQTFQDHILGKCTILGETIPQSLWHLIEELTNILKRKPTVLLLSQETFLPWEIALNPGDKGNCFLGTQTILGRWLLPTIDTPHPDYPPAELSIDSVMLTAVQHGDLKAANKEVKEIKRILDRIPSAPSVKKLNAEKIMDYLRGRPRESLLHFAVHGVHAPFADQSDGLKLNGKNLSFSDVKMFKLESKPFVFLNACEVGSGHKVLGAAEGMPESFLNAGASAVVAPIWAINDDEARAIAIAFYETLRGEDSSSVADFFGLQRANFNIDTDPRTCMSYKFYGHPHLRLTLATKVQDESRT